MDPWGYNASGPYWIKTPAPGRLATMRKPMGDPCLDDHIRDLSRKNVDVLVSLLEPHEIYAFGLTDEPDFCQRAGIRFNNLPIPDFGVPAESGAVKTLAENLADELRKGKNVVVHCHGGIGRSSLAAACVLVVLGLDPREAMGRVSKARGFSVPETPEQVDWVITFGRKWNTETD